MTSVSSSLRQRSWSKNGYTISTDPSLISLGTLNKAFATDALYWAKPLPEEHLRELVQSSLCFGLYAPSTSPNKDDTNAPVMIGFARCVTDYTTITYLTDVFIEDEYQSKGLGSWLVGCVQEVIESMPYLRRSVLITSNWERSVPFYEKLMGVKVHESREGEGFAFLMREDWGDRPEYKADH